MQINTTRFGSVELLPEDILLFPAGLFGFEEALHWVLLGDAENESLAWLQNVSQPELALPVVSPRRFVPDYQVRVAKSQLLPLQFGAFDQAYVLGIVGKDEQGLTLNLKAPLVINLDRRIGRQVITSDDQPLQFALYEPKRELRKSA